MPAFVISQFWLESWMEINEIMGVRRHREPAMDEPSISLQ
jgi:hypothetical protein